MTTNSALRTVGLLGNSLLILMLFCSLSKAQTTTHPRWALHWYADSGDFYIDQPVCGPLEKFTGNPKPFDYAKDLWRVKDQDFMDDVDTKRVGEISGLTVYNVAHPIVYHLPPEEGSPEGEEPGWALPEYLTMVVVERRRGEFCEIHQEQWFGKNVGATPAYFIDAGEKVLAKTDEWGRHWIESYWTFDKNGPLPLDLSPIGEIEKAFMPAGYSGKGLWFGRFGLSFGLSSPDVYGRRYVERLSHDNLVCTAWNGDTPVGMCGYEHIEFEVKDHKLVVTSKEFVPRQN